jgi:hypothetical protein
VELRSHDFALCNLKQNEKSKSDTLLIKKKIKKKNQNKKKPKRKINQRNKPRKRSAPFTKPITLSTKHRAATKSPYNDGAFNATATATAGKRQAASASGNWQSGMCACA